MAADIICKKIFEQVDALSDPAVLEKEDPVIICKNCQGIVTRPKDAIDINNAFAHIFANPQGQVFEIGCFARAECVKASQTSDEFTWFKGYVWAVGLCRTCRSQLGWIFLPARPGGADKFYGLILERLIFP